MAKGPGQKHFQARDPEHAAHQTEAQRHQDHDAIEKSRAGGKTAAGKGGGRPGAQAPKGPRKGQ